MYKITLKADDITIDELFLEGTSPVIPDDAISISDEDGKLIAAAHRHDFYEYKNGKLEESQATKDEEKVAKDKAEKKDKAKNEMEAALARLILGQPMTAEDIQAATDYLEG